MTQHDTSEKRSKGGCGGGILALIILLLIAGTVGYIYYSVVKAPIDLDDPQKLAVSDPMTPRERFVFSPDGTVQVTLDKGDIWHLILSHTGDDFLDLINREIDAYNLSVSGCAIHMDEDGLRLDLELYFKQTRLVAKVPCDLDITGQRISFTPTGVYLGVIPLPVKGLLSSVKLEYDLALPVITQVTRTAFVPDAMILTGSMESDMTALLPTEQKLYHATVFSQDFQDMAASLLTREGRAALVSGLAGDPGVVEALYRDLFTLAPADAAENYLESRHGMTQRFFPGIDFAATARERTSLEEQLTAQSSLLELFLTCVVNDYNEKRFVLSNGQFLKNRVPFQPTQYGETCAPLFEILDPASFYLIIVDAEDGHIRKTSSFYKMADEKQQFTQPVDFNKTYILGCVFRGVTGQYYLMYEAEIHENNTYYGIVRYIPLTEEEVAALQVPGVFGVYTD